MGDTIIMIFGFELRHFDFVLFLAAFFLPLDLRLNLLVNWNVQLALIPALIVTFFDALYPLPILHSFIVNLSDLLLSMHFVWLVVVKDGLVVMFLLLYKLILVDRLLGLVITGQHWLRALVAFKSLVVGSGGDLFRLVWHLGRVLRDFEVIIVLLGLLLSDHFLLPVNSIFNLLHRVDSFIEGSSQIDSLSFAV